MPLACQCSVAAAVTVAESPQGPLMPSDRASKGTALDPNLHLTPPPAVTFEGAPDSNVKCESITPTERSLGFRVKQRS